MFSPCARRSPFESKLLLMQLLLMQVMLMLILMLMLMLLVYNWRRSLVFPNIFFFICSLIVFKCFLFSCRPNYIFVLELFQLESRTNPVDRYSMLIVERLIVPVIT